MPQYRLAERAKAERLEARAEKLADAGRTDVQRATNYVLAVVLFAAALFFAGISTKLRSRRLQIVLLALGATIFVGTVIWLATQPVSVSV